MSVTQWQELLAKLNVTEEEGIEILNQGECADFEFQHQIKLPTDYKDFCQVFGSGMLGDFVRVYCPSTSLIGSQDMILGMIEQVKEHPTLNPARDQNYIELLNSSFKFGDDLGAVIFLWDLRTYSESDGNYNIYCADWDSSEIEDPILVGRDFFEFVQDFCLGSKAYEILPESYQDVIPEEIPLLFNRFKPGEWNPNG